MSLEIVSNIDTIDKDTLTFNIKGVDVCVVNSIRRTILASIPTLVFKSIPGDDNIHITKNTTKFNNEYIKQRISCIPIMNDDETSYENYKNTYKVILRAKNEDLEPLYVTTNDFVIVNKETDKPESEELKNKLFPADPVTGGHSIICVLYPSYNTNESCEEIEMEINFDVGNPGESSCWNIVQTCAYEYLRNETKIEEMASKIEDELEKNDFKILEGQKIVYPNEYKMQVQSLGEELGTFTNVTMVHKACDYIIYKLGLVLGYLKKTNNQEHISKDEMLANATNGTSSKEQLEEYENMYCSIFTEEDNFFVFKLKEDDFTIGKIIEKYLFKNYEKDLAFIGFKKEHPTKKEAFIYIKFHKKGQGTNLNIYLSETVKELISIYENIQKYFPKNK